MHRLSRLLLLLLPCCALAQQSADSARLDALLSAGLHPLNNFSADNQGDKDLAVLKEMIGDHRLVMLGLETYGSGASMQEQVRIAQYLIREMGFGVLVLEGGTYDLHKADRELKAGLLPVAEAMQKAVSPVLWEAAEFQPVVELLQSRMALKQPLTLAGMDVVPYGVYTHETFVNELDAFLRKALPPTVYADTLLNPLGQWVYRMERWPRKIPVFRNEPENPWPMKLSRTDSARFEALFRELDTQLAGLGEPTASEAAWWRHHLRALWDCRLIRRDEFVRDSLMADNLRFVLAQYPDQKVVVLCNARSCVKKIKALRYATFAGKKPVAQRLVEQGVPVYSLVAGAAVGHFSFAPGGYPCEVLLGPPFSAEYWFERQRQPAALLDLHASADSVRFYLGAIGYVPIKGTWSRAVDAVVMLREEKPAGLLMVKTPVKMPFVPDKSTNVAGTVIDSKTMQPVEYAMVTIPGTQVWATTNRKGQFLIKVPFDESKGEFLIDALNYRSLKINCVDMIMNNLNFTIKMMRISGIPEVVGEQEIITSLEITRRSIAALERRTSFSPHVQQLFYRKYRSQDSLAAYEEAKLALYDPAGNRCRSLRALEQDRQIRIHAIRDVGWESWQGRMLPTLDELLRHDVLSSRTTAFDARRMGHFDYELEQVAMYGDQIVFVILYTCATDPAYATGEDSTAHVSGRLYVFGNTFTVFRHDVDIETRYTVLRPVAADSLKVLTITRRRHLTYLYRQQDGQTFLAGVYQTEDRTWANGPQSGNEHIVTRLEVNMVVPGKEHAFRGRWRDLDPTTAPSSQQAMEEWGLSRDFPYILEDVD